MGVQLIFTVETNKKCNSDWIYIKDTVEHFYAYERTQLKLSVVYLDGKENKKNVKKDLKKEAKRDRFFDFSVSGHIKSKSVKSNLLL